MIERDYIMRMIQQLANALARIMRAREQEQYDEAHEVVEEAYGELFGLKALLVDNMAAESLAFLIGDKEKVKILARLLKEEGELCELQGDTDRATAKYQKSMELYLDAFGSQGQLDPESTQVVKSLLGKINRDRLAERYRALARKLNAVIDRG